MEPLEPPDPSPLPGDGDAAPHAPAPISLLSPPPSIPTTDPSCSAPNLPFHGWSSSGNSDPSSPVAFPAPSATSSAHGGLDGAARYHSLPETSTEPAATDAACGKDAPLDRSLAAAARPAPLTPSALSSTTLSARPAPPTPPQPRAAPYGSSGVGGRAQGDDGAVRG